MNFLLTIKINLKENSMREKKMLLLLALSLSSFSVFSETSKTDQREVVEKDNSAMNRNGHVTAEGQTNGSAADVEVTRQLRAKIMADEKLSTNAHNIKIITIGKTMTLEGPVENLAEKSKIEALARGVATNKKIHNKLTY